MRNRSGIEDRNRFIYRNRKRRVAREKVDILQMLAGLSRVDFIPSPSDRPKGAIGTVGKGFEAFILVGEGVDSGQLANRFEKEILKEQGNASRLEAKLGNASFVSNAPEDSSPRRNPNWTNFGAG